MTTPFYSGTVPFTGVDPKDRQFWPDTASEFWIGQPGLMVQLPSPMGDGYQRDPSFSETEHGHPGGGVSVTEFDPVSRWTLPYQELSGRDYNVIAAMRRGIGPFATAPWCYLPPEDTNRLTAAQSLCGGLNGVAEGWAKSAGTLTYDSTLAAADIMSGVLRWSGAGSGSRLVAGGYSGGNPDADTTFGCPYVPSRSWSGCVYAAAASGSPKAHTYLAGIALDGVTPVTTISGPSTTLGTTPTRLSVSCNPGDLGNAAYVVLVVYSDTASAPDLLISCASLSDTDVPNDWAVGAGAPRVIWPPSPSRAIGWHRASDLTVTLAECYSGAA